MQLEQERALAQLNLIRSGTTQPSLSLLLFQGFLLLQLCGHRSQAAAAEAQRQQDPHCGLGQ